jgi:LmbE family N-acetylglucosaminyl deacetylase
MGAGDFMRTYPGRASRPIVAVMATVACALALASPAAAQLAPIPQDRGASGLGLALRRIGVTARVLYVTAHPDDEDNGMLVRLSRGLGVRTAVLTLTRGDGGQNAIGPELFEALSVLRSEELAAIHRYDGAEQYFGSSSDFGYSFSVEETFQKWGREAALGDVVRVVRSFRPDVILTLPLQAPGGGQHHQAAAQLAREAFRVAADPARFPELPGAWQARKIYQGGVGGGAAGGDVTPTVTVRTGLYDPLLGLTWQQLGSVARAQHRSQGVAQLVAPPVEGEASFLLLDSAPPAAEREADVLDGVDLSFSGLLRFAPDHAVSAPFLRADLQALQARVDAARAGFDPAAPEKTLPSLQAVVVGARALAIRVRGSGLDPQSRDEIVDRLNDEALDAEAALGLAHGLEVEAIAGDDVVVPGQSFPVTTRVTNLGAAPVALDEVTLRASEGWSVRALESAPGASPPVPRELGRGESVTVRHEVTVPASAAPTQPYWRRARGSDRFELTNPALAGRPWAPPDVTALVRYRSGEAAAEVARPAEWRYEGQGGGEKQKVVAVGSVFSVRLQPEVTIAAVGGRVPREFRVAVRNQGRGPAAGQVRLDVPAGWSVAPREVPLRFRDEGEEVAARFSATPGALSAGETAVRAVFVDEGGREFASGDQVVAYDHIQERRLVRPAAARVVALDVVVTPGLSVGYVDGTGDEVDTAIRQLGIPLTYLTTDDLAFGDLSRFSTIVTGIRAYQVRADLRSYHQRLMKYAEEGGNLVVQYNRLDFNQASLATRPGSTPEQPDSPYAPYPAAVSSARIADENAPPRIVHPDTPLLTTPNRIGEGDWQGWVQERGLQFLEARDGRYADILAFSDPFPLNPGEKRGALVDAPVGRGRWTYVGLGLFRQLPAGVPGSYRLLANLVGRPRGR